VITDIVGESGFSGDGKLRDKGVDKGANGEDRGDKLKCRACSSGMMSASEKMVKMVGSKACAKSCWNSH
jgi:hypothetical protein